MRYGFILLDKFLNINSFEKTENLSVIKGNPTTIYFRLVTVRSETGDIHHDALRFIPPSGSVAFVSFANIDDQDAIIDRPATQPDASSDRSIFSVTLTADETFAANAMTVKFNDGTNTYVLEALSNISQKDVSSTDRFFC